MRAFLKEHSCSKFWSAPNGWHNDFSATTMADSPAMVKYYTACVVLKQATVFAD